MLGAFRCALDFVRRWGKNEELCRERVAVAEAFRE
jgi:hypothetical protein